ncbi:hypothetical protein N7516_003191, partial [Penicillium verrucosum]|uniref:uncharacterized protein n=1 Tax=Penicillium verrucosum TaxID=60171 RepID=UPI002544F7CC
ALTGNADPQPSNRFTIPFARVPMRNAPPDTRCAHEDGRKGYQSMRPGSGSGSGQGLSTEVRTHPKLKKEKQKTKNKEVYSRDSSASAGENGKSNGLAPSTTPPVPIWNMIDTGIPRPFTAKE